MIDNVKLIAMYLPQYHEIPENNEFWGKGFTDWTTVKSAKQYFKNVEQPKEPLAGNYYDLSNKESIRWQVNLAKQNGIDAFCFYHYWFSSEKNILQTPSEIFLNDKSLDINFCFAWDNASWKRTWSKEFGNDWAPLYDKGKKIEHNSILIPFEYGDKKDWEYHFNYLLPFFKDNRYEKKDGKPIFLLWNFYQPEILNKMMECWNDLAKQNGFNGMLFVGKYKRNQTTTFDYEFYYQPVEDSWGNRTLRRKIYDKTYRVFTFKKKPVCYNYKSVWQNIIKHSQNSINKKIFYGAFVNYDDTPRRGANGHCIVKSSPSLFNHYLDELIKISKQHDKEYIFITAWNEWGEGAYLEPDTIYGDQYLKRIREIKGGSLND